MFEKFQEMEAMLKEHPEMEPVSNDYSKAMSDTIKQDGTHRMQES